MHACILDFSFLANETHRNREGQRMTAGTRVKEEKKQAIYFAIASIICGLIGFFIIFGAGLGLAGAFLGYSAVKQGSKLGYIGLVFGVITFMFAMISPWL